MSEIIAQDTPIKRASIMQMTPDQLQTYVQTLQTRRLNAYNIYQLGVKAKQATKDEKDKAHMAKVLVQFEKKYGVIKRGLDALEKIATEIQVARIAMGEWS